ncbi:hypothetical protein PI124_g18850, partial [Phytophthora idaei]
MDHPWIMTQARNTADFDNPAIMQQTDMKRQLMSSCSPTIATTPLLPSIGSISPANTTT